MRTYVRVESALLLRHSSLSDFPWRFVHTPASRLPSAFLQEEILHVHLYCSDDVVLASAES